MVRQDIDVFKGDTLTVVAGNIRGGLAKKCEHIRNVFDDLGADVYVLSETWWSGAEPPPELVRAIAPHRVFTHGREWERSRAVAIIVHEDLETKGEIKRDLSAGAMAIDVLTEAGECRIAAVNFPPGLDNARTLSFAEAKRAADRARRKVVNEKNTYEKGGKSDACSVVKSSEKRDEAERLRQVLKEWRQGVTQMIIAGDVNETFDGAVDRVRSTLSGLKHGICRAGSTIRHMVLTDGWADMFAYADTEDGRFTRTDTRGSKSRIDYVLTYPPPRGCNENVASFVTLNADPDLQGALNSDHCLIMATVPTPKMSRGMKKDMRPKYRRGHINTQHATTDAKIMFHKIVNDRVTELDNKRWKLAQNCCATALDEVVTATQSILEDTGFSVFDGVKRGRSKASSTSPELRRHTAMRRDLCDLRRQVRASKNS